MKKILSFVAIAAALFSLASCSGDLHDSEALVLPYIIGDMQNSGVDMTVNGSVTEYKFTYSSAWTNWGGGAGKMNFKVLKVWDNWATPGWGPDTEAVVKLNGDAVEGKQGGGQANFVCEDLRDGTEYTLTCETVGEKAYVKLTGPEPVPAVAADLSAINATVFEQPNPYIEIKGDAFNATVGKYFFNKRGDVYVAIIPVSIPADAEDGWGGNGYAAWGKIGVGDGVTVKYADKQFNCTGTELNFDATNNIIHGSWVAGSNGYIQLTANADGCIVEFFDM